MSDFIVPEFDITKEHLDTFLKFMKDNEEHEMYISGPGGCGKTTLLVHYILRLVENDIPFLLGAYTHAACKILREKVYKDTYCTEAVTNIRTVHSFLKKMPGVNQNTLDIRKVAVTNRQGKPDAPKVLLFDEYSMIGEEDYMDIGELCTDEDGNILVKTIYIGDEMQLPPVKSARTIYPRGKYQIELTVNHRAGSSCLVEVLDTLRKMKESGKVSRLPDCDVVRRKADLVKEYETYKEDYMSNKILCYTNANVDHMNFCVAGRAELLNKDAIFVDTHKLHTYFMPLDKFDLLGDQDIAIQTNSSTVLTHKTDTYKTIPYLLDNFDMMEIAVPGKGTYVKAYVFGNVAYMNMDKQLQAEAVNSNLAVAEHFNCGKEEIKQVKANNYNHPAVAHSRQVWRLYLTFKNNVTMVSRPYASTVHKAQGITLDRVFISNTDLLRLYARDKDEYLSLFYTALSRAKKEAFIDN